MYGKNCILTTITEKICVCMFFLEYAITQKGSYSWQGKQLKSFAQRKKKLH